MGTSKRNSNQAASSPASSSGNSEGYSSTAATNNTTVVGNDDRMEKRFKHAHDGEEDEDDDEDGDGEDEERPKASKRAGRRKIKIEYIEDKSRRHITFSKRKSGIMKKVQERGTISPTPPSLERGGPMSFFAIPIFSLGLMAVWFRCWV